MRSSCCWRIVAVLAVLAAAAASAESSKGGAINARHATIQARSARAAASLLRVEFVFKLSDYLVGMCVLCTEKSVVSVPPDRYGSGRYELLQKEISKY